MLPSDDDESETGSGPPPDPSTREWRHPSEIAAAAAAAARPVPTSDAAKRAAGDAAPSAIAAPSTGRRLTVPLLAAGGTTVAVVALVGLALYFATGDRAPTNSVAANQPGPRSPVSSTRPASATPDPGSGLASDEAAAESDTAGDTDTTTGGDEPNKRLNESTSTAPAQPGTGSLDGGAGVEAESTLTEDEEPGGESSVSGTEADDDAGPDTDPATATAQGEESPSGEPAIGELIDTAQRPAEVADLDSIFGAIDGRLVRLGGFVEIDGLLLTSASVVAGHQRVALYRDGGWAEAAVAGLDELSDVAVVVVDYVDPDGPINDTSQESSVTLTGPAIAGAQVYVTIVRAGEKLVIEGSIIGLDGQTKTRTGHKVYDLLRTTLSRQNQGVGAPVHDAETDAVVGIIIDSAAALTLALPIDRAVDIGQSLSANGQAAEQRLGLRGSDWIRDGVTVTEVDPDGAAERAGIVVGDLIVGLDGVEVESFDHLVHLIRNREVGAPITIDLLRSDGPHTVEATIGSSAD